MNTIKRKDFTMHRWFAFAVLVIIGLVHWINGLYHDLDDVKFENEIYEIRLHDYDSIVVSKNKKIDSLVNLTSKPTPSPVLIPIKNKPVKIDAVKIDSVSPNQYKDNNCPDKTITTIKDTVK